VARVDKKTNELVFESNNKRFDAAPVYMQTIFLQIDKMGDTIVHNTTGYANPNIDIHVQYIMALIIDPDERERIKHYRKDRMEAEIIDTMTDLERNKTMLDINMDVIGECVSSFDGFLGVIKKQEIMRVASPRLKALQEKALEKYK